MTDQTVNVITQALNKASQSGCYNLQESAIIYQALTEINSFQKFFKQQEATKKEPLTIEDDPVLEEKPTNKKNK